jgi:phage-related protein
MKINDKPLVWLHGDIKSPPFSQDARIEAGYLLRLVQKGEKLSLPHLRPIPTIGKGCCELRINDENKTWRIILQIRKDIILILDAFEKKTNETPLKIIDNCKRRINKYESDGK